MPDDDEQLDPLTVYFVDQIVDAVRDRVRDKGIDEAQAYDEVMYSIYSAGASYFGVLVGIDQSRDFVPLFNTRLHDIMEAIAEDVASSSEDNGDGLTH